jgi:hypothetical protein
MTICRSLAFFALGSLVFSAFQNPVFANDSPPKAESGKAGEHKAENDAAPQKAEDKKTEESPTDTGGAGGVKKGGVSCRELHPSGGNICPRIIPAPQITMEPVPPFKDIAWEYPQHRYTIIFLLSSWNKRSEEIARLIKPLMTTFKQRHVGVLGYASHDTMAELQKWQDFVRPEFPLAMAPLEVIVREKNPKLPTLWVATSTGQLIKRISLPSDEEIKDLLNKLLLWTEF